MCIYLSITPFLKIQLQKSNNKNRDMLVYGGSFDEKSPFFHNSVLVFDKILNMVVTTNLLLFQGGGEKNCYHKL